MKLTESWYLGEIWTIKPQGGKINTVARIQIGRPAVHLLLYLMNCGKPLHTVKHPEDSLLAFTNPARSSFGALVLL